MDITQLSAILGASAATTGQLGAGLSPAFETINQGVRDAADATARQTQATGTIKLEEANALLNTQRQNLTAASALGSNMGDAAPLTLELSNMLRQDIGQLNKQQAKVAEIEANNDLFTNPLGFLNDLIFGDGERAKLEAIQKKTKTTADSLQLINQTTQQTAATNKALTQTVTDSSILALQEGIKAQTDLAIAESKQKLGSTRVEQLRAMQSFNSAQASQYAQIFNAEAAAEQRAFSNEQRLALAEDRKAAREAKLQGDNTDMELLNNRNLAAERLGLPTVANLQGWKTMIQLNKEREDRLITQGTNMSNGFKPRLGDNPMEALEVAQKLQIPLSPAQQQMIKKTQMLSAEATTPEAIQAMFPEMGTVGRAELLSDKKRRPELVNKYLSGKINAQRASINPQDPTSLYAPAPIGTLAEQPYMAENKFLADYYLPSAKVAPDTALDGAQMAEFAMDAIKKGVPTDVIVDGIKFLGTQSMNQNNLMYDYTLFGLPIQESLRIPVALKGQGFWATGGFSGVVDITKGSDIERMLAQVQAEMIKRERNISSAGSTLNNMFP